MHAAGRTRSLVIALTTLAAPILAQPKLLTDINRVPARHAAFPRPGWQTYAERFTTIGRWTYFAADDGEHGRELFRTDGTAANTTLVADLEPGIYGSEPSSLTVLGNQLILAAASKLWLHDPATGSTTVVPSAPRVDTRAPMVAMNGEVYFAGNTPAAGWELWKSNGRTASLVVDLMPGSGGCIGIAFSAGNRVFFNSCGGFYASDGTAAGTRRLSTTRVSWSQGPVEYPASRSLVVYTGGNQQLWVTNGSPAGTRRITSAVQPRGTRFQWFGGAYYFMGGSAAAGVELWKTDGTAAGTVMLRDIVPGTGDSWADVGAVLGPHLYFHPFLGNRWELWRTDGTTAGTVRISTAANAAFHLAAHGKLFGQGRDGFPWVSDGTAAGTIRLENPNHRGRQPAYLSAIASPRILFSADDGNGFELWTSDGTPRGTRKLVDLTVGYTQPAAPEQFTPFAGEVYFSADDGRVGRELWKTDGTASGTRLVADTVPGSGLSAIAELTPLGDRMLFTSGPFFQAELWATDGTTAGTTSIDVLRGPAGSQPSQLTVLRGVAYFAAEGDLGQSTATGRELWCSDGTTAGTRLVADLRQGPVGSDPSGMLAFRGALFFAAEGDRGGSNAGRELWRMDAQGNVRLFADLLPGPASSAPSSLTRLGQRFVFAANSNSGRELWISDGTRAGTRAIDLLRGPASSNPSPKRPQGSEDAFVVAGDHAWFVANGDLGLGGPSGPAIWRVDAAGRVSLVAAQPAPDQLAPFRKCLVFRAGGYRLYLTDGTAAGTKSILGSTSQPASGVAVTSQRFFLTQGIDYAGIKQLWRVDHNRAVKTTNYFELRRSDSATVNGKLLFAGIGSRKGHEIWTLDVGTATRFGFGCAASGDAPDLSVWDPVPGQTMFVDVQRAAPNKSGVLAVGVPGPPIRLGNGCFLEVGGPFTLLPFRTDAAGRWRMWPRLPYNATGRFNVQAAVFPTANAPLGLDLTNACSITPGR